MITARHFSAAGQEIGTVELPEAPFSSPSRPDVVYDALRSYHANQRQGTAATKTRSMVSGGGKKPWRQKGTGRARHGSIRSPIWVGGSTVFGPQPRDYSYQIPRKMRSLAIRSVLSERARDGKVVVVDDITLEEPRTAAVAALLKSMNLADTRVLLVGAGPDVNLYKSVRNLPRTAVSPVGQINVYELLDSEVVVFTRSAVDGLKGGA